MVNEIGRLRIYLKSEERLWTILVKTLVTIGLQPVSVQDILCQELRLNRPYLVGAFPNLVLSNHCHLELISTSPPIAWYVHIFLGTFNHL